LRSITFTWNEQKEKKHAGHQQRSLGRSRRSSSPRWGRRGNPSPDDVQPRDLSGIVGTAIELVNKFKNGDDVESTLVALQETLEMLDFEIDALSRPDHANTMG
jgi:hypothetical protein